MKNLNPLSTPTCNRSRPFMFLAVFSLLMIATTSAASAADDPDPMDWPHWRGPEMNGISREKGIVAEWNPKGTAGFMDHAFHVADSTYGIAVAYDMLYHCFSNSERAEIERAMAEHGVYMLYHKLSRAREGYVALAVDMLSREGGADSFANSSEMLLACAASPRNRSLATATPRYGS